MTKHGYGGDDLTWKGNKVYANGKVITRIEPDAAYPGMWRVRKADGSLSDMVNLTRAKDAAKATALSILNAGRRASG